MRNTWKTKAAFLLHGRRAWTWVVWTHDQGNMHAAIIRKADELGAVRWDFSQADHELADRATF